MSVLEPHFDERIGEVIFWTASVLIPSLAISLILTHMVMRKVRNTVDMAKRLSRGDLGARITTGENDRDVFNQLATAFNDMADSLERLMQHEKRLLADISHELRSPLTRMGVATALLSIKREEKEIDAMIKVMEDEIDQMNRLVEILLTQGRDRLKGQDSYTDVDLSGLVAELLEPFSLIAERDGKTITRDIDPDAMVRGHPLRIRMIVDNIVSNALFYAPKGSAIEVAVGKNAGTVRLSVRDYGPGVPGEHLSSIFKAFFKVDQSRTRASGGAGLGLTLANDATVAMGGEITAENVKPGLRVTVVLPRVVPARNGETPLP